MPDLRLVRSFAGGVLCANSLPHLATAVSGRHHLTPVRGPHSSRWVNLCWGAANLLAGMALARASDPIRTTWDRRLVAFDAGAATFALWMATSEAVGRVNWR
jgi:hypothetical protein